MSSSYQSASLINMELGQNLHKTLKNPWPVFPVQTMYLSQFYHLNYMNVDQDSIIKFNFNNVSMIHLETASNEQTKTNKHHDGVLYEKFPEIS